MMKFFTLVISTVLLAISTTSTAQSSFINLKSSDSRQSQVISAASISFNAMGIAAGVVKIKMFNQPAGIYILQVKNADGKIACTKKIDHSINTTLEIAELGKQFEGGTYQLELISPDNTKTNQTIMLLI